LYEFFTGAQWKVVEDVSDVLDFIKKPLADLMNKALFLLTLLPG